MLSHVLMLKFVEGPGTTRCYVVRVVFYQCPQLVIVLDHLRQDAAVYP